MSAGRLIKKFVQLVAIDNDCILFSREFFQKPLSLSFMLGEHTKDPSKNIYITDKKEVKTILKNGKKQVIPYIQKINFTFIDKQGTSNFRGSQQLKKLYTEFIKLKNKKELKKFIEEKHGFCVFPNELEMETLFKEYEKAGITKFPIHYAVYKHPIPKKIKKESDKTIKDTGNKIKKVSIDFIWKKQQELKRIVELYSSKNLTEHNLLWLNKQLENVSEALMSQNNFIWTKVRDGGLADKDNRSLEEMGMKKIKNLILVPAYRIYGHYALCCLEFYLDIQNEIPFFTCEKCGQLNVKSKRSRKYCSKEDNSECSRKQDNKRQEKYYNEKINKV